MTDTEKAILKHARAIKNIIKKDKDTGSTLSIGIYIANNIDHVSFNNEFWLDTVTNKIDYYEYNEDEPV